MFRKSEFGTVWILLISLFVNQSHGAFVYPFLEPMSPEPEGVRVNPDDSHIWIEENIPRNGGDEFKLNIAKIRVTGNDTVNIATTLPPTTSFSIELIKSERYLVLNKRLDYETEHSYVLQLKQGIYFILVVIEVSNVEENLVRTIFYNRLQQR